MKKSLFIVLGIFLIIISSLTYFYYTYMKINLVASKINKEYEKYTQNTIIGSSLISLINKSIDKNEKNEVEKDSNNRYIENDENSIKIQIKFLESDKLYDMEAVSALGSESFVKNYNNMNFNCTKKEYHKKTKQIKYMLFEQI